MRIDQTYAKVTVGDQETSCVIDCGSTVTIIREDMAAAFGLNITKYTGAKVNGVTGDKLVPIGKAHMKMTIEESQGQIVHVHSDAIVVKDTPIKLLVGNNVNMRTKCVIDFTDKTIKFNTIDMHSKAGIYVVICKQCRANGGNAIHIKQDCLIPPRATTVTTVVAENRGFVEDVVCMLIGNPKTYTKDQLLIPNSVNKMKGGKTYVAISNGSHEPNTLGAMVGFYEKLDATTLVDVTNDLGNNWTNWRSTKDSGISGGQCGQIMVGAENSRCHDTQHISCVVLPKVENSVISGASTGQTERPKPSNETSIKTGSDALFDGEVTDCLCQCVPKLVREPTGDGHKLTDKCIPMKLGGEVLVGVTLNGIQKKKLKKLLQRQIKRFAFRPEQIGRTSLIEHEIKTGDAKPIRRGPYKCSLAERDIIKKQIQEYTDMAIMSPARSPWGARVVLVKKHDGTFRFCADWRGLNICTEFDTYPMVDIEQALASMRGCKWISKPDPNKGYYQVKI